MIENKEIKLAAFADDLTTLSLSVNAFPQR